LKEYTKKVAFNQIFVQRKIDLKITKEFVDNKALKIAERALHKIS